MSRTVRATASAVVFLALLSGFGLVGCGSEVASGEGERSAPAVTVQQVQPRPWNDVVRALGTATALESVVVTAKVSETVEQVHFDSGDVVEAGDPLVTLSGRQQRAALAEAQATADEAERLYRRQAELAEQQLIARAMLDSQRATRDAARARVAQIRAQLADRVVNAPFSGVLGLRQVSPGSLVTPGTPIATLDDTSTMYVDFPVPEALLARIEPGQQLVATSAAFPEREFSGEVATIDSRIDPATRAVMVRGQFPNADGLLRPGMLMQVVLSQPARPALLVPEIAVVQVGNSSFVYRLKPDSTVERVDVQVGGRRDGWAEITSGLTAGDRIVIDGTGKLRPGIRVDAQPNKPFPAPAASTDGSALRSPDADVTATGSAADRPASESVQATGDADAETGADPPAARD